MSAIWPPATVGGESLDLAPSTVEPIIDMTPKTTGVFFEFNEGVTGVNLSEFDPPQSNFYNSVVEATSASLATASLRYDNTNLLSGLPGSVRCSVPAVDATGTGATYFTCADPDLIEASDHYGTLYLRLDTANTVNLRPIEWRTEGGDRCGFLRVTTAQTVAFFDRDSAQVTGTSSLGGAGVNASTTTLAAGGTNWYRLEWHLSGTAPATVTVRIYVGHSATITETLTFAAVDLRDLRGTIWVGNPAAALLGGHDYQIAAVAEGGTDWFGPYPGAPRSVVTRILNEDGVAMFELHSDGSLIKRLDRTVNQQPGGATHTQSLRGQPMFRVDPVGSLMIGPNRNYGSSVDYNVAHLADIFLNSQTGRISGSSADFCLYDDPSDIAFSRKFPMYPSNRTGVGAATTNGSAVVTFTDLTLELLDIGRYCTIGGTPCHIIGLISPTSCTMDTTFGATASGLAWTAKEHPNPGNRMKGVTGTQSHIGQIRLTTPFTPPIRQSTLGTCTISAPATPAVIAKSSHGLVAGDPVVFTNSGGALPTGLTAGTIYFVISAGLTGGAFQVSATPGGAAINTTVAGTGTHTVSRPLANVTSGSGVVTNMPGFTSADVGRALLFQSDFTLGEFVISAVTPNATPSLASVTVAKIVGGTPLFTAAAASWHLTGGQLDQEVRVDWQPFTMLFGTAGGGARSWTSSLFSAPAFVEFAMATTDTNEDGVGVGLSSGGGAHVVMHITGGDDSYGHGTFFGGHAWVYEAGKTLGYKPGAGVGANVNQATSKTTGVTINASSGRVTTFNDALNAGLFATFTVTNSYVKADDIPILAVQGPRAATYRATPSRVQDGSFDITLQNWSGSNQSDNVTISFALIKGAGTT